MADLGNRALGSGSDRVGLHGACKPHEILRPSVSDGSRRWPTVIESVLQYIRCHRTIVCILLDLARAARQLTRILIAHRFFPCSSCMLPCRSTPQASHKSISDTSHIRLSHKSIMGLSMTIPVAGATSSPHDSARAKQTQGGLRKRHSFSFSCILHLWCA
jgi:hypothetical protein